MNDFNKTLIAVLIAAGMAAAAYLTRPAPISGQRFSDQGETFFPPFTDPAAARSLQVLSYDQEKAEILPFKVQFDGQRWVIPSHHDYPADAATNMAKASSVFIGLQKEQVVSDRTADHEALGVLSPEDPTAPLQGRGTRVTIQGEGGAPLADLIIGKPAPASTGAEGATVNRRYVRVPEKNRVYAAVFEGSFSTSFGDWVETDLLQMQGQRVDRYGVNRYSIDEQSGTKQQSERLTLSRPAAGSAPEQPFPSASWQIEAEPGGAPGPGEMLDSARIEDAIAAARDLKIVGVRPKPEALATWFAGAGNKVTEADVMDLQARGFFLTREGQFVANEGEVSAACADGVVYTLYFGEVLRGSGEELSSGADPIKKEGEQADKPALAPAGQEARYAFVRVSFDESMVPMPPAPVPPAAAPASAEPETPAEPAPEPEPAPGGAEPEAAASLGAPQGSAAHEAPKDPAQVAYEGALAERKTMLDAGKARAEALKKRFANWYYVIDDAAFKRLRPARADLVKPDVSAGQTPGMPGGGMIPNVGPLPPGGPIIGGSPK